MQLCSFGALVPYLPKLNPPTTRCRLRFSPPYSTSITVTAATPGVRNNDLMVDFLINSLGFSRDEAISASIPVRHLKSPSKPELVLNLLQKYGFNVTQIREIVSSAPRLLSQKPYLTLEPKIKFFLQDIGFSRQDFVKLIKKKRHVLNKGLDSCIIPTFNYLKEVLGDDDKVVQTVRDSPWVLSAPSTLERMQLNVRLLQNYGVADEIIRKFIIQNPRPLLLRPEQIKNAVSRVDKELGILIDSPRVLRGICVLAIISKADLEMKYEIFKSVGWTDLNIRNMSRVQPYSLTMSGDKIRGALNFLMKELGYGPDYLSSHPTFLMYSLEKRVKPRYEVLKILKENKLVEDKRGIALYSVVGVPESTFLNKYVLAYEDKLPNLYEIYSNSRKQ